MKIIQEGMKIQFRFQNFVHKLFYLPLVIPSLTVHVMLLKCMSTGSSLGIMWSPCAGADGGATGWASREELWTGLDGTLGIVGYKGAGGAEGAAIVPAFPVLNATLVSSTICAPASIIAIANYTVCLIQVPRVRAPIRRAFKCARASLHREVDYWNPLSVSVAGK